MYKKIFFQILTIFFSNAYCYEYKDIINYVYSYVVKTNSIDDSHNQETDTIFKIDLGNYKSIFSNFNEYDFYFFNEKNKKIYIKTTDDKIDYFDNQLKNIKKSCFLKNKKNGRGIIINGIEYCGFLEIIPSENEFKVVNVLDIDDYIASIMATIFKDNIFPDEVLSTYAIVLRSFILNNKLDTKHIPYDGDAIVNEFGNAYKNIKYTHGLVLKDLSFIKEEVTISCIFDFVPINDVMQLDKLGLNAKDIIVELFGIDIELFNY